MLGQPSLWKALQRGFETGKVAHAFLLVGQRGSGKGTAARFLAAAALCRAPSRPCGECESCRRVLAGTHPDLIELKAPEASKSGAIGVDEVRELTRELSEKPFGGDGRAVLVRDAHKMTPPAQNALLKTLEEPGAGTVFLLLAEQEEALLPTIRSRCRIVRLGRLSLEEMWRGLLSRGVLETEIEALYEKSDGILGRALEIRGNDEIEKMEAFCASLLGGGGERAMVARLYEAAKFEKAEQALFFDRLEGLLRRALARSAWEGESGAPPGFTSFALHSMMKEMLLAKKRLSSNVSFASAIEPLFWRLFGG